MRLLVVEDEAKLAGLLARGLQEEGYAVDVTDRGADAVWMAQATPYDAILLDVMLPDLDGFDVARRLRTSEVWSPVLMLTARDAVDDRVAGLDAGADDYLPKPFAFDELLARVRALVRRTPTERPVVFDVDGLRFDRNQRRVWRDGVELDLSPKELALLELFMRKPGTVLTRSELLDGAWDISFERRSNVVDVYVRSLREKIDRPFGRASIETVRGIGYRLREDA
jgi:two-component system OmpR family response regulator